MNGKNLTFPNNMLLKSDIKMFWVCFCPNKPQMFNLPLRLALIAFEMIFLEAIKGGKIPFHIQFAQEKSVFCFCLNMNSYLFKMLRDRQNSPNNANVNPGHIMKIYKYPQKADPDCGMT